MSLKPVVILFDGVMVSDVSLVLKWAIFYCTILLRHILYFYAYKIKPMLLLQDGESEEHKSFALQYLARMVADIYWHGKLCLVTKSTFPPVDKLICIAIKFEH